MELLWEEKCKMKDKYSESTLLTKQSSQTYEKMLNL